MASTVGMLVGILALVAGVLVLSFGITSLHTSIDDLHSHIHANEAVANSQQKQFKDLSKAVSQGATGLNTLAAQLKKDEESSAAQKEEIQHLRGDLSKRMEALSQDSKKVADGLHEMQALREALTEERKKGERSAQQLAEMQGLVQTLLAQQRDATQSQKSLESTVESVSKTLATIASKASSSFSQSDEAKPRVALAPAPPKPQVGDAKAEAKDKEAAAFATQEPRGAITKPQRGATATSEVGDRDSDSTSEAKVGNGSTRREDLQGEVNEEGSTGDSATGDRDASSEGAFAAMDIGSGRADAIAAEADRLARTEKPSIKQTSKQPMALAKAASASEDYHVSWYRECGCTGMEIEAVNMILGLIGRIGKQRVRTNHCDEGCQWPEATKALLQQVEVEEERMLWPREPQQEPHILVVHVAFEGVCGVPDGLNLPDRGEGDRSAGLYRVSRSMMETDRVMTDAANRCNTQFDEVWVPSAFNMQTFTKASVSSKLLHVLPEGVDTELFKCKVTEQIGEGTVHKFGIDRLDEFIAQGTEGSTTFTFLSVFKWEQRKNWHMLLDSFWDAFPTNKTSVSLPGGRTVDVNVRLLIKTQQLSWGTDVREDVTDFLRTKDTTWDQAKERFLIVTRQLPTEAMPMLYHSADAFVLPSHGEGWGLPIIEAMSSGLPTIATGWGGQTEFMTQDNSWPLQYTLQEADMDPVAEEANAAEGSPSHKWAVPDEAALKQALMEVVQRTPVVQAKAKEACQDVRQKFSIEHVAAATDMLLSGLVNRVEKIAV